VIVWVRVRGMFGGLFSGGEICCHSVDACSESEYRNKTGECEIYDALRGKQLGNQPIFAEHIFRIRDEDGIGQKQKQYHHHEIDTTFEQCDDGGIPGGDVYAKGAEDAEAVIGVLIQRHRVKRGHPDVYSRKVVEQDE